MFLVWLGYYQKFNYCFVVFVLAGDLLERDKKMADKLMCIPNNDTQNCPFYRLK